MTPELVVIKYGGAAMQTPAAVQAVMQDIIHLKALGMCPVVVHGGGPEISKMCQKMGIAPIFINGLRVTDQETLEIAQLVLIGKINKELVSQLNQEGGNAVGISGYDGNLLLAKQADPCLGLVGEIEQVNPTIITTLIQAGFIPVIAPIAAYNINADSAAAAIAIALKAAHLILLTDVAGVLKDAKDLGSKIDAIKSSEINTLIKNGCLLGGMIPKIKGALTALQGGVSQVHILDGRVSNCLSLHFKGIETKGTSIYV
jgi:acetylglutamate kinase